MFRSCFPQRLVAIYFGNISSGNFNDSRSIDWLYHAMRAYKHLYK